MQLTIRNPTETCGNNTISIYTVKRTFANDTSLRWAYKIVSCISWFIGNVSSLYRCTFAWKFNTVMQCNRMCLRSTVYNLKRMHAVSTVAVKETEIDQRPQTLEIILEMIYEHIEAKKKWPPFCRWQLRCIALTWNVCMLIQSSPSRCQAVIWANCGYTCMYQSAAVGYIISYSMYTLMFYLAVNGCCCFEKYLYWWEIDRGHNATL